MKALPNPYRYTETETETRDRDREGDQTKTETKKKTLDFRSFASGAARQKGGFGGKRLHRPLRHPDKRRVWWRQWLVPHSVQFVTPSAA